MGQLERMLAETGFTPLLVNLESLTARPSAGGGQQTLCRIENACMYFFVYIDKVTTVSFSNYGK